MAALGLEGEADADLMEAIPRLVALIPHDIELRARGVDLDDLADRGTAEEWLSVHVEERAGAARHREVRDEHEPGDSGGDQNPFVLEVGDLGSLTPRFASGLRAGPRYSLPARAY